MSTQSTMKKKAIKKRFQTANKLRDENAIKLGKMADKMLEVSEQLFSQPKFSIPMPTYTVPAQPRVDQDRCTSINVKVKEVLTVLQGELISESIVVLSIVELFLQNQQGYRLTPVSLVKP